MREWICFKTHIQKAQQTMQNHHLPQGSGIVLPHTDSDGGVARFMGGRAQTRYQPESTQTNFQTNSLQITLSNSFVSNYSSSD